MDWVPLATCDFKHRKRLIADLGLYTQATASPSPSIQVRSVSVTRELRGSIASYPPEGLL